VGSFELETVINAGDSDFTLGDEVVLVNVITQQAHLLHSNFSAVGGHQLVEDMVATLQRHLGDDTSLLQQICIQISMQMNQKVSNHIKNSVIILCLVLTYRTRYQHQPIFQRVRNGYG